MQINVMKNTVLLGQVLNLEDIHDNMVVTSMAGNPLKLQRNPFRVRNTTILTTSKDIHYKNGVVHTLMEYPLPSAPWLGKTMQDILKETNKERKDDLSDFIAYIAVTPDIQMRMQTTNSTLATTLFVPTNNAIAAWNHTWMQQGQENVNTTIQQLVQNHIVDGNFVKCNWWMIPTGIKRSSNDLRLQTIAGQTLDLFIDDGGVTINGNVTILQEDIFSEYGIIHIIDKVL